VSQAPFIFAKLAALYYERYEVLLDQLKAELPDLYSDLPERNWPSPDKDKDFLFSRGQFDPLVRDMAYIFEVKANSELKFDLGSEEAALEEQPRRVFISHGRSPDWREVQDYIEKDLNILTLELAQEPSKGRTVLQKLNEESNKCSFAVVVMTGDDNLGTGAPRARENVMHEIGFFQGKYGLANVCLLHEEGTNIPSNIHGLVYIPFPKALVSAAFGVLSRELRVAVTMGPDQSP
jgi:hypothetical protein